MSEHDVETMVGTIRCARCGSAHEPTLTHGACPVCGLVSDRSLRPDTADTDDRQLRLAIVATAMNLLLFGLIFWYVVS